MKQLTFSHLSIKNIFAVGRFQLCVEMKDGNKYYPTGLVSFTGGQVAFNVTVDQTIDDKETVLVDTNQPLH